MAHKTLTISEKAYDRLLKEKNGRESFTDVIIRITTKKKSLLEVVKKLGPNKNLSDSIEKVYKERSKIKMRDVEL
ncbi:MAG: antitoxin [Candidatus Aenigmarchaeota archaeon]|nr:antitoxin [Candidatus Aenigmarchaeota archaeon]